MIAKSSTNPVFLSGRQGAEDAAKELTKSSGVTVKIGSRRRPKTGQFRHSASAKP
jgi:hypothetical protein